MVHGTGQLNTIWHDLRTLPSGGSEVLDLFNLTRSLFESSFSVSFSGGKIRGITIENINSGVIAVGGSGASAFDIPFGGATGIPVNGQSTFLQSHTLEGWDVDSDNRHIQVLDTGGLGSRYRISIVGSV